MGFLHPEKIKAWYLQSLEASGYRELDSLPLNLWKKIVLHGKMALPPGFLGNLIERLTHKSAGLKEPRFVFPLEEQLLEKICKGTGFEHLEGLFILSGGKVDPNFFAGVVEQIVDRIPGFHSEIEIASRDLDASFSSLTSADSQFQALPIIEKLYQKAIDDFSKEPFYLDQVDLFEISHPQLFIRPADRTFYRVMMASVKAIATWARGVFSLQEELPMVVAKYGEPQMLLLGGYDSLTNKGDIASLVPSELAFIDETMAVDMFDYKFLENQLMFFKREEGAVFRIRRHVLVQLELTPFLEHERHLGLLFAWCLTLAEKILEAFVKDIVKIEFQFLGYQPSAMKEACEFFRHFLNEKGNLDRVSLELLSTSAPIPEVDERAQCWILGKVPFSKMKHIPLEFPQTDEFAEKSSGDQEKILGEIISNTVEKMVGNAYR